ncbi:hypothetical protein HOY82DRAFT_631639 [Tuber indicum]|nr:hypothetical protein HOY82DRAFT_631639 [Tuber indicum]
MWNVAYISPGIASRRSGAITESPSPSLDSESPPVLSGSADPRTPFAKLLELIPAEDKLHFSTAIDLAEWTRERIQQCLNSSSGCYVAVTGVSEEALAQIDQALRGRGIRNSARFTYEGPLDSLIIRLMPGAPHDIVSRSFFYRVGRKIDSFPRLGDTWAPLGSAEFEAHGRRKKQGDEAIKPVTRSLETDWPSLVIEVGHSESLQMLRFDAEWWLKYSAGQTNMVIIIKIKRNPNSIRLECWEMYRNPTRRVTRSTAAVPTCRQWFNINNLGMATPFNPGQSLEIPYLTIFDTGPQNHPTFVFSQAELSSWALYVYSVLG